MPRDSSRERDDRRSGDRDDRRGGDRDDRRGGDRDDEKPSTYKGNMEPAEMACTLFVAQLAAESAEVDVRRAFEEHGASVHLPLDNYTQKHRGYGFLTLEHASQVEEAVEKMMGFELFGRPIKVEQKNGRAPRRGPRSRGDRDDRRGRRDSRDRRRRDSRDRGRDRRRRDSRDRRR